MIFNPPNLHFQFQQTKISTHFQIHKNFHEISKNRTRSTDYSTHDYQNQKIEQQYDHQNASTSSTHSPPTYGSQKSKPIVVPKKHSDSIISIYGTLIIMTSSMNLDRSSRCSTVVARGSGNYSYTFSLISCAPRKKLVGTEQEREASRVFPSGGWREDEKKTKRNSRVTPPERAASCQRRFFSRDVASLYS